MSKARQLADLGGDTANLEDISSVLSSGPLSNRNLIINGANNIWQRSTSATLASAGTYITNDRWKYWAGGATLSSSRTAFTAGQTDVPNFEYYNRIVVGSNSAAGAYATFNQHVENVVQADAQTFTLSFYAKASQSWTIGIEPVQNFGSGGSTRVLHTPVNVTVGTTWQRHTVTFTTDSITGKTLGTGHNFELAFWLSGGSDFNGRTGSIGNQSGTFDITGVQLEVGDTATPFEHRSYGQELALCQRYFVRQAYDDTGASYIIGNGYWGTSTLFEGYAAFPVMMRSSPSVSVSNISGIRALNPQTNFYAASSFAANETSPRGLKISWTVANSGLAKGIGGVITMQVSGSSISYDAEL
jgi:hypothetical protein